MIKENLPEESKIFLVTFEQREKALTRKEKILESNKLSQEGITLIQFPYRNFGLGAVLTLTYSIFYLWFYIFIKKVQTIYARCTPAGAIGYFLSTLSRKKLILDSFEPHAEAMLECGAWRANSISFRSLFYLEKLQLRKANTIITCVPTMEEYIKKTYGIIPEQTYVIPACIKLEHFNLKEKKKPALLDELNLEGKIVCVYAGKFGGSYLGQECFDFFAEAEKVWGDKFRALLLTDHPIESLIQWAKNSGFDFHKFVVRYIPHAKIASYIGLGDFGLTPFLPVPSKRYGSPIKTGEYWAMGLPVVITKDISTDSSVIKEEKIGAVINDLDRTSYQKALEKIEQLLQHHDPHLLEIKIREIAYRHRSFQIAENVYKQIFN